MRTGRATTAPHAVQPKFTTNRADGGQHADSPDVVFVVRRAGTPGARRTVVGIDIGGGAAIIYRMAMIRIVAQLSTLLAVTWGVFVLSTFSLLILRPGGNPLAVLALGAVFGLVLVAMLAVICVPLLVLTRNVARRRVALALVASLTVSVISFVFCAWLISESADTMQGNLRFWGRFPAVFLANFIPFPVAGCVFGARSLGIFAR